VLDPFTNFCAHRERTRQRRSPEPVPCGSYHDYQDEAAKYAGDDEPTYPWVHVARIWWYLVLPIASQKHPRTTATSITVSVMGELRLYAIGIDEVRGMFGASPGVAAHLREVARRAFAPPNVEDRGGLLSKLGPIFKRVPATPVISPTQPEPHDVEVLLAGAYVPPDRTGATWRLLETLVQGIAWGSTRMALAAHQLDDLDFALARGGVSASVGLRHLLNSTLSLNLVPVQGLTVGWHPYQKAVAMSAAYRSAMPGIKTDEQREMINSLTIWLDGFVPWAQVAASLGRPVPDLVGFWAV
jgi:hypothetical protein